MPKKRRIADDEVMCKIYDIKKNGKEYLDLGVSNTTELHWLCENKNCENHSSGYRKNPRQIRDSLRACPEAKGCTKCAHTIRGEKRRELTVKKNGSLADIHPGLAIEWLTEKSGGLDPSQISAVGGRDDGLWRCRRGVIDKDHERYGKECGNLFSASVRDRLKSKHGYGCKKCYELTKFTEGVNTEEFAKVKFNRQIIKDNPELFESFDEERNGPLNRTVILVNTPLWWKCLTYPKHGSFKTALRHRIAPATGEADDSKRIRSCNKCAVSSNPRIERALNLFLAAVLHEQVEGWLEVEGYRPDAYLPALKTIIEYDGPKHKGKEAHDRKKDRAYSEAGFRVLRLRDKVLAPYSGIPINVRLKCDLSIDCFRECAESLVELVLSLPELRAREASIKERALVELGSEKALRNYLTVPAFAVGGPTAAEQDPWLLRFYSGPDSYSLLEYGPRSSVEFDWICPLCGVPYPLSIANRCRSVVCRQCAQIYAKAEEDVKETIEAFVHQSEGPALIPLTRVPTLRTKLRKIRKQQA